MMRTTSKQVLTSLKIDPTLRSSGGDKSHAQQSNNNNNNNGKPTKFKFSLGDKVWIPSETECYRMARLREITNTAAHVKEGEMTMAESLVFTVFDEESYESWQVKEGRVTVFF